MKTRPKQKNKWERTILFFDRCWLKAIHYIVYFFLCVAINNIMRICAAEVFDTVVEHHRTSVDLNTDLFIPFLLSASTSSTVAVPVSRHQKSILTSQPFA